jgi:pilus assembly protein CpaB
MNWKTWAPLILAIVLGVVAAKIARDTMLKNRTAAAPTGKLAKIVVAKNDIMPGSELKADDLTTANVDADKVPASSFPDASALSGRVAEVMLVKNSPVVEQMLAPTGTGSGLQALVPAGMRAITMEVNEFSAVAGLITPGCHVDVIATIAGGDTGSQVAKTIVQNVKITAVGQRTNVATDGSAPPPATPNEMYKSVTMLCSPADAEAIELACSTGRPRLVLRSGRDNDVVPTAGISLGELRGQPLTSVAAATTQPIEITPTVAPTTQPSDASVAHSEPPHRTIKVIRGGQESTVTMLLEQPGAGTDTAVSDTNDDQRKDPFDSH